jgi:hypothetical protein
METTFLVTLMQVRTKGTRVHWVFKHGLASHAICLFATPPLVTRMRKHCTATGRLGIKYARPNDNMKDITPRESPEYHDQPHNLLKVECMAAMLQQRATATGTAALLIITTIISSS